MQLSSYQYWVLDEVVHLVNSLSYLTIFLQQGKSVLGDNGPPIVATVPLLDLSILRLAKVVLLTLKKN